MSDILDYIRNRKSFDADPEGNLVNLADWNENIAQQLAAEEDILLSSNHIEVIQYLRAHYRDYGQSQNGRLLLTDLADRFAGEGGKKYLYSLFPHGPIMQGCKIAGIPAPPNSADPSFGSVH